MAKILTFNDEARQKLGGKFLWISNLLEKEFY